MEKKPKTYWQEFYPFWWKRIKSWYAFENWKQAVTTIFFTIAIIWMYIYINQIEVALDNILQLLLAFLAGILWFLVVSPISYIVANIDLYNSKKEREQENNKIIEQLNDKLNQEPVDVDLDIYEWARYETEVNTQNKMVCVVVKNLGNEDIRCYGALTFLVRINADNSPDNLFGEAILNGSLISWNGGGVNEDHEVLIKAGHERILNVAQGIDNHLVFKMENLDFIQYQNGTYALDLEIGGHIGTKKISKKRECFYIEYHKIHKTFAGGTEKPYSSTDISINSTSVTSGYHQYSNASFRKLDIKKRNCENDEQKT